ncbi:hypothetical protein KRR38_16920 [Novosphingobium sp. G106]|uniref:hypothetical protein n=1 Tax=Novosphingobium sp. G106 TaxID=2849500 RepID=UPI001C2D3A18|nr:hypothetical protein [Novosphingobium sp. G106]MBV1689310.1 hypothetical protein [Novosphingobium sp. G106]
MTDKLYVVIWVKDGVIMNLEEYAHLEDAKRRATENMKLYRSLGIADSALVRGQDGAEYMRLF